MKILIGIALGLSCAIVVACGGSKSAKVTSGPGPVISGKAHNPEIEQLDREITEKFTEMGLTRPATAMIDPSNPPPVSMSTGKNLTVAQDPECRAGSNDTCTRSCTLADSICTNATRICKIAEDLGDDAWAKEKCASSTESCKVAHESCCSCS